MAFVAKNIGDPQKNDQNETAKPVFLNDGLTSVEWITDDEACESLK